MTHDEADQLQRGFVAFAEAESSWRALALLGSWARGAAREDSDLDLIALVDRLAPWTTDDVWLRGVVGRLGLQPSLFSLEVHGVARSWRVLFGPGVELEITFADRNRASTQPLDGGTRRVVSDGMQPLVDKDGLLHTVTTAVFPAI